MIVDLFYNYDAELFNRCYDKLLQSTFTISDELEPKENIEFRLVQKPDTPQPETHFIINRTGMFLSGVLVLEIYRKSNVGLITYLATNSRARKRGIAKGLISYIEINFDCDFFLAEVHNPHLIENDIMNPFERVRVFNNLGFFTHPMKYIQPALSPDKKKVETLSLLCLPVKQPTNKQLVLFLEEFYCALGIDNPQQHPDFKTMIASIL